MLTLAGQLSKNEFSVYEVKCYFYVDEKSTTERYMDEKSRTMRREELLLCGCCLWSKMLPFTRISLGFHLGLPCFGEETMLFWIMFICSYIYSNLLIICFQILTKMLLIVKRSKYIEVRFYFKVFVEANAAVQLDLNFVAQF